MSSEQYTKEMGKLDDRDKEIAKLQYTVCHKLKQIGDDGLIRYYNVGGSIFV